MWKAITAQFYNIFEWIDNVGLINEAFGSGSAMEERRMVDAAVAATLEVIAPSLASSSSHAPSWQMVDNPPRAASSISQAAVAADADGPHTHAPTGFRALPLKPRWRRTPLRLMPMGLTPMGLRPLTVKPRQRRTPMRLIPMGLTPMGLTPLTLKLR